MNWLVGFLASSTPSDDVSSIGNTKLESLMNQVDKIGGWILTCIYVVLGVFLVIKGALLGIQIVKAADEPQVRQEKIGALKWLVIGVAIGYGVALIADLVIDIITDSVTISSSGSSSGSSSKLF